MLTNEVHGETDNCFTLVLRFVSRSHKCNVSATTPSKDTVCLINIRGSLELPHNKHQALVVQI